ncbi:hypothetical protein ACFOEY_10615 [Paracandidimonas soli]|uniref:hypothetical protein n=1 Tax=Paracandidimonas soli TaxID=1917182 RepID=UPI0036166F8D
MRSQSGGRTTGSASARAEVSFLMIGGCRLPGFVSGGRDAPDGLAAAKPIILQPGWRT